MPGWGGREVAPRRGGFEVAPPSTKIYTTQLLVNRAKTACSAPRAFTHRLAAPSTENLTRPQPRASAKPASHGWGRRQPLRSYSNELGSSHRSAPAWSHSFPA